MHDGPTARDGPEDFVTADAYVDTPTTFTRVPSEMPGSYQPMTPSRVREDGGNPNPGSDIYSGLGYDGADRLRIGAGFDLARKNVGIIGRRNETGSPVFNGIEKGIGGQSLPHLDLSLGVGRVNPVGVSSDEGAVIPPIYVGNPTVG